MHLFSIFVLAMGLAATALGSQQADNQPTASPANDSRLLRMTWEVNSCVSPTDDPTSPPQECFRPAEFRQGDRLYLRETPAGECMPDGNGRQRPVVLSFVQDNSRTINSFFGCIVSDQPNDAGSKLAIVFIDDPLGQEERRRKTLTIQHVRVAGNDSEFQTCLDRLGIMSDNRLSTVATRVCKANPFSSLVHWNINTNCVLEMDSDECVETEGDQVFTLSPPDDGQGTASGND